MSLAQMITGGVFAFLYGVALLGIDELLGSGPADYGLAALAFFTGWYAGVRNARP